MRLSLVQKLLVCSLFFVGSAGAQTVRFQTSVGAIDMQLNPTNNVNLQRHVDNMLANIAAGKYLRSVVNRAAENFVLQFGGFTTDTISPNAVAFNGFKAVTPFDPVIVDANNDGTVDFSRTGLTNTRGTVSLALSNSPNTGTSSFFVNLTNNAASLDSQNFIPFARVSADGLAVVDRIMALRNENLTSLYGQASNNLAYTDVPLTAEGNLVVVEAATVLAPSTINFIGPLNTAFKVGTSVAAASAGVSALPVSGLSGSGSSAAVQAATSVPEPSTVVLGLLGLLGLRYVRRS